MAATLSTDAQILLAIGQGASAAQISSTNTDIWGLIAESDMERAFGNKIGLVANYASITAAGKQHLALVHSYRTAFYGISQDLENWDLATSQSKLDVCDSIWKGFLSDLKANKADLIADLGL